jgi:hypothetical protein
VCKTFWDVRKGLIPIVGRSCLLKTFPLSPTVTPQLQVCKTFWDVRKGLIPIVGAAREPGTSMLIEDVACPVDKLADMMIDLIDMFQR